MKRYGTVAAAVIAVGVLLAPLAADPALAADATPDPTATSAVSTPAPDAATSPTPTPEPPVDIPSPTPSASTPTPLPTPKATQPDSSSDAVSATAAAVPTPSASRIAIGADAYGASVRVSTALFPSGADTVILAPSGFLALASASLAGSLGAAVLYVQPTAMPAAVLAELRRLAPTSILVAGGTALVSDAVLASARTVAADVRRIGAADVFTTARLLFDANTEPAGTVYISDGTTIDDIPQATAMATSVGTRALVVNARAKLDAATIASLRAAHTTDVVVVESTSPVPVAYTTALTAAGFRVARINRPDRYTLSTTVAGLAGPGRTASILVNPDRRADTGMAAYVAAVTHQPLYYAVPECMPDGVVTSVNAAGARVLVIGDTTALGAAAASRTTCSTEKVRLVNALTASIRSTMAKWPGSYTVTVRELGNIHQIAQINGGVRREPASMMKIFAAWAAYTLIAQHQATTSTRLPSGVPLGVCIQIMIHVSDNYCHTDIVHWISIPRINSMIRAAGFTNTSYGNVRYGTSVLYAGNRTTTNDVAYMLERLSTGSVLSKTYADAIIGFMRTQIWRSRIPSGLPPGIPQASKPGSLWVASGLLQNDTAIVTGPTASYVLTIMGDGNPPKAALAAISRTVYSHFNGSFGAAASYPVQQMITRTASVLRSSPGGAAVKTIPPGVLIEVLDANRVWYEIQYGTRKLWVYYTGLRNR